MIPDPDWFHPFSCPASPETSQVPLGEIFVLFCFCFLFVCLFCSTSLHCREGNGTPLQYSCLENPVNGGAWKAAVHGVAEGQTRLNDLSFTLQFHSLEKEMATHSTVLA